jgi:FMN-dependent NADH-azoreductase
MTQILIVESSPRGTESARCKSTNKLRERLQTPYPEARVIERGPVKDKLPHLDQLTLKAISRKDPVEAESLIGIEDVQTIRAEGMNIPPLAASAVPNGEKAVEALVI